MAQPRKWQKCKTNTREKSFVEKGSKWIAAVSQCLNELHCFNYTALNWAVETRIVLAITFCIQVSFSYYSQLLTLFSSPSEGRFAPLVQRMWRREKRRCACQIAHIWRGSTINHSCDMFWLVLKRCLCNVYADSKISPFKYRYFKVKGISQTT